MIPPWLLPSKNRRRVSITLRPFFWNAGCDRSPRGWIISRRAAAVEEALLHPVGDRVEAREVAESPRPYWGCPRGEAGPRGGAEHEVVLVRHRAHVVGVDLARRYRGARARTAPGALRGVGRIERRAWDAAGERGGRGAVPLGQSALVEREPPAGSASVRQVARHGHRAIHPAGDAVVLGRGRSVTLSIVKLGALPATFRSRRFRSPNSRRLVAHVDHASGEALPLAR